jgi:hypothetical protein
MWNQIRRHVRGKAHAPREKKSSHAPLTPSSNSPTLQITIPQIHQTPNHHVLPLHRRPSLRVFLSASAAVKLSHWNVGLGAPPRQEMSKKQRTPLRAHLKRLLDLLLTLRAPRRPKSLARTSSQVLLEDSVGHSKECPGRVGRNWMGGRNWKPFACRPTLQWPVCTSFLQFLLNFQTRIRQARHRPMSPHAPQPPGCFARLILRDGIFFRAARYLPPRET